MTLSEMLLLDFDQEMANTRRTLERVPVEKPGWKPHEKSMSLGRLAQHVAELPSWAIFTIGQDSLDILPWVLRPISRRRPRPRGKSCSETFDKHASDARTAIAGANDEHLMKPWTLLMGGRQIFSLPRVAVLRTSVLNHSIHHRAQLGVYLRLNDLPVPGLYGPSADEGQW